MGEVSCVGKSSMPCFRGLGVPGRRFHRVFLEVNFKQENIERSRLEESSCPHLHKMYQSLQ